MAEPVLALESFSYRYPGGSDPALEGVDLDVRSGELVVVAGRSGSGKSTLLRAACGLVPHYHGGDIAGSLTVCGLDVRDHGPADLGGLVGMVGQDPETQVVSSTVRGELELPLELRGEPAAARARAIEEVTLALAIPHLLKRPLDTLSGGELQRVALAAALVLRPRVVLLDEPTSQLDPVAGDELVGLLARLNREWGMGVLIAEHRLERCLAAADRALLLDRGRLAFDGSPHALAAWCAAHAPALAPPGARLFAAAGLSPVPVSVKEARRTLAALGIEPRAQAPDPPPPLAAPAGTPPPPPDAPAARRRGLWARLGQRTEAFPPALAARGLRVVLDPGTGPREVLGGIELRIARGERVAVMGRNGAGKSTLLRVAAGLVTPAAGAVEAPAGCALLPQAPGDLFVHERVGEELPGEAGRAALAAVGLEHVRGRDPRDLSGGERERLALAIVAAGREPALPGLVCLDEPTRGMDGERKRDLAAWLDDLARRGTAAVVATHDVEFAAAFAARVVLLGDGVVLADGPADEILSGGWYFATEVARILGARGAITPEQGARLLAAAGDPVAGGAR